MEGKTTYSFTLSRRATGQRTRPGSRIEWPWRDHPWEPRVRYVRLRATSPTYGEVTLVIVDEPRQDQLLFAVFGDNVRAVRS